MRVMINVCERLKRETRERRRAGERKEKRVRKIEKDGDEREFPGPMKKA